MGSGEDRSLPCGYCGQDTRWAPHECTATLEIARLRAALARSEAERTWQPLKTAPKDETVLVTNQRRKPTVVYAARLYDGVWDLQTDPADEFDAGQPITLTHWAPMPARAALREEP